MAAERVHQLLDVAEEEFNALPGDKKKEVIHSIVDSVARNLAADPG